MQTKVKILIIAVCGLLALGAVSGCVQKINETPESNPFYAFDEVRELNRTLEMPFLMGESESAVKAAGFEATERGIPHHNMTYRSKENLDVVYTLSTYELYYGEPDPQQELYVTGFRITQRGKTVVQNPDGTTKSEYKTDRSVHGIRIGDNIEGATKKLLELGYEPLIETPKPNGGLPQTREYSYRKGIIIFTLGVENTDEISQMNIWIPYHEPEIDGLNKKSKLPADLGLTYSVLTNPDFVYAGKTKTSRRYEASDGSVAIMRGFPDYRDMMMTAEVSFSLDKYNVFGVTVGMSEQEAVRLLEQEGCTLDADSGYYIWGKVAAIRLTVENGAVTNVAACLRPSTNLANVEVDD